MATVEEGQRMVCYRHPRTETAVTCSDCERPICPDCMIFGPVGIRCPECSGRPTGARAAATRLRAAGGEGSGFLVTKALLAVIVALFLVQVGRGGLLARWSLFGPAVADGEWWRLVTAGFLHLNGIHLLFNGLALWWFGGPLEALLGRGRFVGVYAVSLLAGSAGALLVTPEAHTVGASGGVFGILGAGLVLERRRIYVFGGGALMIVALNLVFTFAVSNVSIGGHVGGLVGGILAALALTRFGRGHPVYGRVGAFGVASLVLLAAVSVAIAYARVRGLA